LIDCIFERNGTYQGIRIQGYNLTFLMQKGSWWVATPRGIEDLKLDINGIFKEFPNLKDKFIEIDNPVEAEKEVRRIAIERFKEKLKKFNTEEEIKEYLIQDMRKHNYNLVMTHKKGFRVKNEK